jgi:hypothetical protein
MYPLQWASSAYAMLYACNVAPIWLHNSTSSTWTSSFMLAENLCSETNSYSPASSSWGPGLETSAGEANQATFAEGVSISHDGGQKTTDRHNRLSLVCRVSINIAWWSSEKYRPTSSSIASSSQKCCYSSNSGSPAAGPGVDRMKELQIVNY